jgi:PEGA domain
MTSTSIIGTANPPALARTLREVIAHQPELVNEVWCRKIFRHILLQLERHHALHLPHQPISPDTIGFDAAGDAVLMPAPQGDEEPGEAADVQALGAVVHHAITGEGAPAAPLRGRAPGYSESLVGAVDKCISPDPAERPQSIAEMRDLLGIVALGPAVAPGAPSFEPALALRMALQPAPRAPTGWRGNWQRWLLVGLACIVLLAAAAAFLALLRDSDAGDNVVLTLPEPVSPAKSLDRNERLVPAHTLPAPPPPASAPKPAPPTATALPHPPAATAAATRPPTATAVVPARAGDVQPARQPAQQQAAQAARDTAYKLMIRPWGTVYVDGDERGVSPPLKKLSLPAGRHTVRVVNPNFPDRLIRVEAGKHVSGRIEVDFTARSR